MATIFVLIIYAAIVIFGFLYFSRTSNAIHSQLNLFMERAQNAASEEELNTIKFELLKYSMKECWHPRYLAHTREVISYIHGRLNCYSSVV